MGYSFLPTCNAVTRMLTSQRVLGSILVLFASSSVFHDARTTQAGWTEKTQRNAVSAAPVALSRKLNSVSACDSVSEVCFRDSAYAHTYPGDPGPIKDKWWIFFGGAGDSLEIRVESGGGGSVSTHLGEERDRRSNNFPYQRQHLMRDGVIEAWVVVDDADALGDTVPYTLRFRRVSRDTPTSLRATGQRAIIMVSSSSRRDRFVVLPLSVANTARNFSSWSVDPGTYNVALVKDSLYKVCKMPCASGRIVKLLPMTKMTLRF